MAIVGVVELQSAETGRGLEGKYIKQQGSSVENMKLLMCVFHKAAIYYQRPRTQPETNGYESRLLSKPEF